MDDMERLDWIDAVAEKDELRRMAEDAIFAEEVEARGLRDEMALEQERDFFNGLLDKANEAVDFFDEDE